MLKNYLNVEFDFKNNLHSTIYDDEFRPVLNITRDDDCSNRTTHEFDDLSPYFDQYIHAVENFTSADEVAGKLYLHDKSMRLVLNRNTVLKKYEPGD